MGERLEEPGREATSPAGAMPPHVSRSRQGGESHDLRKTGIHPDYWYPLARSRELRRGKTLGVSFAGEPIVLVRTKSGALFALEDRCAHRQVPLHAGVVRGEHLQCGYHRWTYDCSGACISLPYAEKHAARPRGVRSYPCREAYGLIFVYPGNIAILDHVGFPDVPSQHDPQYKTRYLNRQVRCHYSFMHENLMDMNHQFLHRRLMGSIRAVVLDLREGENWIEVDYGLKRAAGTQSLGERFMLGESSNGTGQGLMTIRTGYPYQTLQYWTPGSRRLALDLWNVYVPVDRAQRINHTFGLMMIRKPSIPGLIHVLWPFIIWFTEGILAQDRWIVEQEQAAFDAQGADWNQEIFSVMRKLRALLGQQGVPL